MELWHLLKLYSRLRSYSLFLTFGYFYFMHAMFLVILNVLEDNLRLYKTFLSKLFVLCINFGEFFQFYCLDRFSNFMNFSKLNLYRFSNYFCLALSDIKSFWVLTLSLVVRLVVLGSRYASVKIQNE